MTVRVNANGVESHISGEASNDHAVFEVSSYGCRSADLLIVDSAFLEKLASNWRNVAQQAMRNPQIVIHDRSTYKLRNLS